MVADFINALIDRRAVAISAGRRGEIVARARQAIMRAIGLGLPIVSEVRALVDAMVRVS